MHADDKVYSFAMLDTILQGNCVQLHAQQELQLLFHVITIQYITINNEPHALISDDFVNKFLEDHFNRKYFENGIIEVRLVEKFDKNLKNTVKLSDFLPRMKQLKVISFP